MKKAVAPSMLIAVVMLAVAVIAEAQQPAKVFKFGELVFKARTDLGAGRKLLRRELSAIGYVEGKNIAFEIRSAEGKLEQFLCWPTSWSVLKST